MLLVELLRRRSHCGLLVESHTRLHTYLWDSGGDGCETVYISVCLHVCRREAAAGEAFGRSFEWGLLKDCTAKVFGWRERGTDIPGLL